MVNNDEDLPLHDEAKARAKWRGEETIIAKGSERLDLPASEVDNAAEAPAQSDPATLPGRFAERRPPD